MLILSILLIGKFFAANKIGQFKYDFTEAAIAL